MVVPGSPCCRCSSGAAQGETGDWLCSGLAKRSCRTIVAAYFCTTVYYRGKLTEKRKSRKTRRDRMERALVRNDHGPRRRTLDVVAPPAQRLLRKGTLEAGSKLNIVNQRHQLLQATLRWVQTPPSLIHRTTTTLRITKQVSGTLAPPECERSHGTGNASALDLIMTPAL